MTIKKREFPVLAGLRPSCADCASPWRPIGNIVISLKFPKLSRSHVTLRKPKHTLRIAKVLPNAFSVRSTTFLQTASDKNVSGLRASPAMTIRKREFPVLAESRYRYRKYSVFSEISEIVMESCQFAQTKTHFAQENNATKRFFSPFHNFSPGQFR